MDATFTNMEGYSRAKIHASQGSSDKHQLFFMERGLRHTLQPKPPKTVTSSNQIMLRESLLKESF